MRAAASPPPKRTPAASRAATAGGAAGPLASASLASQGSQNPKEPRRGSRITAAISRTHPCGGIRATIARTVTSAPDAVADGAGLGATVTRNRVHFPEGGGPVAQQAGGEEAAQQHHRQGGHRHLPAGPGRHLLALQAREHPRSEVVDRKSVV